MTVPNFVLLPVLTSLVALTLGSGQQLIVGDLSFPHSSGDEGAMAREQGVQSIVDSVKKRGGR